MASPAEPPLPTLTDDLLEEIFLRLPTPADLGRACTACASFRRIITDRSFLRRFRAIHPPPLLAFVGFDISLHPAQPPHPSAPLARALADAADFSYSFVPPARSDGPWYPRDVRQGRVLLESVPDFYDDSDVVVSLRDLELVVCDPLYRLYVMLPRIPYELTAEHGRLVDFGILLAPTGDDEEETSFRVICTAWYQTKLFAFVFSSINRQWHIATSQSCSSLGTTTSTELGFMCSDCTNSRFYFTVPWTDKLLVLDAARMEFSIVNKIVPSGYLTRIWDHGQPCVVASAEGSPLIVFLSDQIQDGSGDVLHVNKLNENAPSDQWQLNLIPLPRQYRYVTLGAAEGFVFLRGTTKDTNHDLEGYPENEYFSVDIRTSELKKVCGMKRHYFHCIIFVMLWDGQSSAEPGPYLAWAGPA
ncbi:hypothetical protein U9M48_015564 [Paspalum notatum var. saurae]|uniref:F-box domain-containing protein n=1 Tax=Paspalum notatum var. saurae TaxID=547442 RepID=A0AAQ3T6U0_PASNO